MPYAVFVDQCIQKTQTCSGGGRTNRPIGVETRVRLRSLTGPQKIDRDGMLEILWLFERDDIFARHTQRLIPRLRLNALLEPKVILVR